MSQEDCPELLTNSWVVLDSENQKTSNVEEVNENEPQGDSDTDSFSVISESGCSYKTDEDECQATEVPTEKQIISEENNQTNNDSAPEQEINLEPTQNNDRAEKLIYFATSAACAIILIAFSVAIQNYFQSNFELDHFDSDYSTYTTIQNVPKKLTPKRKNQILNDLNDNVIHDKIIEDNDPKAENNFRSNYKLNKNKKTPTCNKENSQVNGKQTNLNNEENNYNKKIKELELKEDYLREKEKFLIEKEHNLLKEELKLNKEKENLTKNKHDKNKKPKFQNDDFKKKEKSKGEKYRKSEKESYQNVKHFKVSEENRKRNISGQWYINLHEGRDNMRQRKRSSFKRNKAHWYFQWMVDRARLRVK